EVACALKKSCRPAQRRYFVAMAKLVVFGASGDTGRVLVAEALAAGHTVTAFARNPAAAKLPDGARAVAGDVLDAGAVAAAVAGQDVVVSAIGHRRKTRSPFSKPLSPPDLFARGVDHMIDAMRRHDVRRLLVVGVHGAGDSRARTGWLYRWLVEKTNIGLALADNNVMEARIAARVREDKIGSFASIARADVARYLLAHVDGALPALRTPSLTS